MGMNIDVKITVLRFVSFEVTFGIVCLVHQDSKRNPLLRKYEGFYAPVNI